MYTNVLCDIVVASERGRPGTAVNIVRCIISTLKLHKHTCCHAADDRGLVPIYNRIVLLLIFVVCEFKSHSSQGGDPGARSMRLAITI